MKQQDDTHEILETVPWYVVAYDWRIQHDTAQTLELLSLGPISEDIAVPFRPLVVETDCKIIERSKVAVGGILC
jgi:hypothetical protein